MHSIITADRNLFRFINDHLHSDFFDMLMPYIRNSITWVPFYIFMLVLVLYNFGKDKWFWILFTATAATLSNFISSNLIKDHVPRLRPCNDPEFIPQIKFLLIYRPQSSSFTSSHAVNHFTLAAFFFYTLRPYIGKTAWWFFVWAAVICFAQVYVSVHFPLDVFCGGIIGFWIGYAFAFGFNKYFSLSTGDQSRKIGQREL